MEKPITNITGFRLLDAIMKQGSLSQAAQTLDIKTSSASHILANMKARLGDDLFHRTGSGLEPTQKMRTIYPNIMQALASLDGIFVDTETDLSSVKRNIRLLVCDTCYVSFVVPVLHTITEKAPGLDLEICLYTDNDTVTDGLRHGLYDLGIYPNPPRTSDFRYQNLHELQFVLLVRKDHPLTHVRIDESFDLKTLIPYTQVIPSSDRGGYHKPWFDLKDLGMKTVVCPYSQSSLTFLAQSDAIQWLPEVAGRDLTRHGDFAIVPLPAKYTVTSTPKLFWPSRVDKDPVNQWLRSVIVDAASRLGTVE